MLRLEDITIDPEFRDFLPTVEDSTILRGKIELEGWSDEPITVWMPHAILLDGHRRYEIWKERGDDGPSVREMKFATREAAFYWVVNNQRARRNLTPEQERYLLGRKYTAEKGVKGAPEGSENAAKIKSPKNGHLISGRTSRRIAAQEGVSKNTVENAENYANAVDNLHERGVVSKSDILSGAVRVPASKVIEASRSENNEEAKDMIITSQKGVGDKKKSPAGGANSSKASANEDSPGTPKQREIAVYAIHDVIDYLKRSPLVRLGMKNPFREYAYKQVIGWLKSNMKDKTHGSEADETDD
jgi:hypothetical protein